TVPIIVFRASGSGLEASYKAVVFGALENSAHGEGVLEPTLKAKRPAKAGTADQLWKLKVGDEFTVPLGRVHHRDLHSGSDEKKWREAPTSSRWRSLKGFGAKRAAGIVAEPCPDSL